MMQLYSGTTCPFSHRCRFVLYEKGMDFQVIDVDLYNKPEDIAVMNPYNRLPVLVERDLILYESNIINEYIDERFPHPQLMPADPVMRARARLMLFNMEVELFSQIESLESGKEKQVERARQHVTDRLIELAPVFTKTKHMLGDDFTMLDVAIAPLLWRLDHYGIKLGKTAAPLMKYGEITLNISPNAVHKLQMGNELIEFSARFGGVARQISVPIASVFALYARETGHGMTFDTDSAKPSAQAKAEAEPASLLGKPRSPAALPAPAHPEPPKKPSGGKPTLRRIR